MMTKQSKQQATKDGRKWNRAGVPNGTDQEQIPLHKRQKQTKTRIL